MTNRKQYVFFSKFDDPLIEETLDKGELVIMQAGEDLFQLFKRKNSIGTAFELAELTTRKDAKKYVGYLYRDCQTLKDFLDIAKVYLYKNSGE